MFYHTYQYSYWRVFLWLFIFFLLPVQGAIARNAGNVSQDEILVIGAGKVIDGNVAMARKWVARKLRRGGMGYPKIGEILNRSHTTVMSILGARR